MLLKRKQMQTILLSALTKIKKESKRLVPGPTVLVIKRSRIKRPPVPDESGRKGTTVVKGPARIMVNRSPKSGFLLSRPLK